MEKLIPARSYADMIASLDNEARDMDDVDAEALASLDAVSARMDDNVDAVRRALNTRLALARKYDIPEYRAECARLLARLHALRRGA